MRLAASQTVLTATLGLAGAGISTLALFVLEVEARGEVNFRAGGGPTAQRVRLSTHTAHCLPTGGQQPGLLQGLTQESLSNPEKGGGAPHKVEADKTPTSEEQNGGAHLDPRGLGAEYGVWAQKPPIPENLTSLQGLEVQYEQRAAVLIPLYSATLQGSEEVVSMPEGRPGRRGCVRRHPRTFRPQRTN